MLSRIEPKSRANWLLLLQGVAIVLAAWFVFGSAISAGWLWDDGLEITNNPVLRHPAGLWRIWFSPPGLDYFPLKTTLQWVQWHLWGAHPAGYHATNLALHVLNAFLLWRVLASIAKTSPACPEQRRRDRRPKAGVEGSAKAARPFDSVQGGKPSYSWLAGLLFVVHPLTVESVAWISEFKNVLSLAFLLLAFSAWIEWDQEVAQASRLPSLRLQAGTPALLWYGFALLIFLAAMLSKSSVVMFPVVLLLYAWWKRGGITGADLRATLPFFAVSLALGLVTVWFQVHRAIANPGGPSDSLPMRAVAAGREIAFYFFKSVWPVGLLPIYPRWAVSPLTLGEFLPWVVIGAVVVIIWRLTLPEPLGCLQRRRCVPLRPSSASGPASRDRCYFARTVAFGLGWFLLNLLPVMGFVPMAYQRISWVADHLAYLPLAGLVGLAGAGIGAALLYLTAAIPVAIVIVTLAIQSRIYAADFQSEKTLWSYTVDRNPQAWIGYNNLGIALRAEGRRQEAIALYEKALSVRPDFAEAHNDLGVALAEEGRLQEAFAQYEHAIRIEPDFADAYNNEGNLLLGAGHLREATNRFAQALRINPDFPEAHNGMGNALVRAGRVDAAIAQYEEALHINPDFPEAQSNLGAALASSGRLAEAIQHYEQVLLLRPDFADAHNNLGVALARSGRIQEAMAQYRLALHYQPDFPEARANLKELEGK